MEIPLSRPWITEADVSAVVEVLRSPSLSLGPRLSAFEREMARYCGTLGAVAVSSGTAGLHLGLIASDVGAGDEVITSPFSFIASANCALYVGARPVFADIDPRSLTIDPDAVADRVGPRTRAMVPVDVFGQPVAMDELLPIAARHDLAIVRDACEAIGAERDGERIGREGTASVFAFYPNKQMTTGEGGIVVSDDLEFLDVVRSLANQGRDDQGTWMNHVRLGFNARMDEMSAALGRSQLARIDDILARRARVASWYVERLEGIDGVEAPWIDPRTTRWSPFVFVVRLDPEIDRPGLMAELARDGIPSRPYFVPIHLQPLYRERFGHREGEFPVTEAVARTTLALPFFTEMTELQVDHVCNRIAARRARSRASVGAIR